MVSFTPNIIVCPNCETQFTNNKVNGVALIEIAQTLETRKRMHCRLTLDLLERDLKETPYWPIVKKAILDGYNDLARDLHTILGFGVESE